MGGHAFQTVLGPAAKFPRMKRETYNKLKQHVIQRLSNSQRFAKVSVAPEDPEKPDFGDLDVVVTLNSQFNGQISTEPASNSAFLPIPVPAVIRLDELKEMLSAKEALASGEVFRTFAIAASTLDIQGNLDEQDDTIVQVSAENTSLESLTQAENRLNLDGSHSNTIFYQVDVNVVQDPNQHEAIIFYNSYGDLGLMLSLFTKTIGLGYSRKGLKIESSTYRAKIEKKPFYLTASTPETLSFLGLDYESWKKGFQNRSSIFEWIVASRFTDRDALLDICPSHLDRPVYQDFLKFLQKGQTSQQDATLKPDQSQPSASDSSSNSNSNSNSSSSFDPNHNPNSNCNSNFKSLCNSIFDSTSIPTTTLSPNRNMASDPDSNGSVDWVNRVNRMDGVDGVDQALDFFGKRKEFEQLAESIQRRNALKAVLNGRLVISTIGIEGIVVKRIIDHIKAKFPVDILIHKTEEEMRAEIKEAYEIVKMKGAN